MENHGWQRPVPGKGLTGCAFYGKFCPADDYFWFNGYANLESADFAPDIICIDDIAKYIDNNENDLGSEDVAELLEAA